LGQQAKNNPLSDWDSLIVETARRMKVPIRLDADISPIMLWEELLYEASQNGFEYKEKWQEGNPDNSKTISEIEKCAKQICVEILKKNSIDYPIQSRRSRFLLQVNWGSIISLNFDEAWLATENDAVSRTNDPSIKVDNFTNENKRMYRHLVVLNECKRQIRVWYPNGNIRNANSIRMGLHDFGEQPHAIKQAFSELKAFERQILNQKEGSSNIIIWENYLQTINHRMEIKSDLTPFFEESGATLPITWVTEFLYRPLLFVGVGLSDAEIGIWWLLCQRQRNLARIPANKRPSTRILVKRGEREAFWQSRPFGVDPIFCNDWDEGWDQIDVLYEGKKAW
jgi:hypothetical protein